MVLTAFIYIRCCIQQYNKASPFLLRVFNGIPLAIAHTSTTSPEAQFIRFGKDTPLLPPPPTACPIKLIFNSSMKFEWGRYDDPQSSSMKYELAASLGLRGIGVYAADFLNYSSPNFYQPMWRALESFFPNNTASTSSPVSSSSSPASTLGSLFLSLFYYVNTNGS